MWDRIKQSFSSRLRSPVDRWGAATAAIAAVIASVGLVVAVLGTIAAINTWIDVDNARTDFEEALARTAAQAEELGAAFADVSRRAQIERELEAQGIQLVEVDGDARPEFLRFGDQLVELPEPVQIPKPPTFLEEAGGEIFVAVIGGAFLIWATVLTRGPNVDQETQKRLAEVESQLANANDERAQQ